MPNSEILSDLKASVELDRKSSSVNAAAVDYSSSSEPAAYSRQSDDELLTQCFKSNETIWGFASKPVQFAKPLLTFKDNPLIYPRAITLLQGQKGAFKSRFAETMLSVLLHRNNESIAGIKKNFDDDIFVLYIDTERSEQDNFAYSIQSVLKNAGFEIGVKPDNFFFTSFTRAERKDRLKALQKLVSHFKELHKEKFFVFIDICSDLVNDFNNPTDVLILTDYFNYLINEYDIQICTILHENPNSTNNKSVGHLGSELTRKAASVLVIGLDTSNLIYLKYLHLRNHKKPQEKYYFQYNDGGFAVNEAEEVDIIRQRLYELYQIIGESGKLSQQALIDKMKAKYGKSTHTHERALKELEGNSLDGKTLLKERIWKENYWYFRSDSEFEDDEEITF